ncbi:MAG: glycosyltransferase family 39 protein [Candidatus Melainabacteria bacterium]|nr:glycosyltransferase family 39 protein [Candidatus Melainabacteria bacterium]
MLSLKKAADELHFLVSYWLLRLEEIFSRTCNALQKSEWLFLLGITSLCFAFLMIGLNGDSPICTENDELCYAPVSLFMVNKETLDPGWFTNPASTTIYSLALYYKIIQLLTGHLIVGPQFTPTQMCFRSMDLLLKWPRLTSVAFVLLSLPLLYVVGKKWVGKAAATLGVTFYALSPLVVYYGQILRPDMLANFLIVLCIFLLDRLCEITSSRRLAVVLGVVIGLSVSTRFFCLALVVPLATVYGVALIRAATAEEKLKVFSCGLIAAGVCFLTFFATSPFVFFDFHQLLDDLKFETQSDFAELTGLGPMGNLHYYVVEGIPEAIGVWLTGFAALGLILVPLRRRTFKTLIYLTLLTVFAVGTCMNPRHWARWVLPVMPVVALLAGFGLTGLYDFLNYLLSKRISASTARITSLVIVLLLGLFSFFFPLRRLLTDQWQKSHLSERALVYPYITSKIPLGSKIALDSSWDWPNKMAYQVTEDIWRPDFVPPRPHNYHFPEDLARAGFQYMIVQRWNREYYMMDENKAKYPSEYAFYHALSERAPLIFNTYKDDHPYVFGKQIGWRVSPVEVYDLRPLANTKLPGK